jgi:hypothetical protein
LHPLQSEGGRLAADASDRIGAAFTDIAAVRCADGDRARLATASFRRQRMRSPPMPIIGPV